MSLDKEVSPDWGRIGRMVEKLSGANFLPKHRKPPERRKDEILKISDQPIPESKKKRKRRSTASSTASVRKPKYPGTKFKKNKKRRKKRRKKAPTPVVKADEGSTKCSNTVKEPSKPSKARRKQKPKERAIGNLHPAGKVRVPKKPAHPVRATPLTTQRGCAASLNEQAPESDEIKIVAIPPETETSGNILGSKCADSSAENHSLQPLQQMLQSTEGPVKSLELASITPPALLRSEDPREDSGKLGSSDRPVRPERLALPRGLFVPGRHLRFKEPEHPDRPASFVGPVGPPQLLRPERPGRTDQVKGRDRPVKDAGSVDWLVCREGPGGPGRTMSNGRPTSLDQLSSPNRPEKILRPEEFDQLFTLKGPATIGQRSNNVRPANRDQLKIPVRWVGHNLEQLPDRSYSGNPAKAEPIGVRHPGAENSALASTAQALPKVDEAARQKAKGFHGPRLAKVAGKNPMKKNRKVCKNPRVRGSSWHEMNQCVFLVPELIQLGLLIFAVSELLRVIR